MKNKEPLDGKPNMKAKDKSLPRKKQEVLFEVNENAKS